VKPVTVKLGEWLPDLPFYDNPGLTEALNCLPVDGQYTPYQPVFVSGDAIANRPQGAFAAVDSLGNPYVYVGDSTKLYVSALSGTWTTSASSYTIATTDAWNFAQYGSLTIATDYADVPQAAATGTATFSALATVGTAPNAKYIGVVGQFVVLGYINNGTVTPYQVQWSSINQPQNWPTPGSAAAIASQAGSQTLRAEFGAVTGIFGSDQVGLILQKKAIVRMVYQGGNTVFSFDTYEQQRGGWFQNASVRVGTLVYYIAADGFYVTDGVQSTPIGKGKVDRTFLADCDQTYIERVRAAIDVINKCIYWCYPSHSATNGLPDRLITYNYVEGRWSHSQDMMQLVFPSLTTGYTLDQLGTLYPTLDAIPLPLDSSVWQGGQEIPSAFNNNQLGTFSSAPATATFESGEVELNPMGRALIQGIRPLVTGNPTSITLAVSSRTTQDNSSQNFSTPVTPTASTGICDMMQNAKFVAMQMQIAGGFTKAMGASFITTDAGVF
jgi:hypothetical protein